jgi:hypothetical protein
MDEYETYEYRREIKQTSSCCSASLYTRTTAEPTLPYPRNATFAERGALHYSLELTIEQEVWLVT